MCGRGHPEGGELPGRCIWLRYNPVMRIFVATYALPKPDLSAGDRRMFEILRLLARRHRIDLWTCNEEPETYRNQLPRYRSQLQACGIRLLPFPTDIHTTLSRSFYDVGYSQFYWVAERVAIPFRRLQPHAKLIVDSVDVHFAREALAAQVGVGSTVQAEETKRREIAAYAAADAVIAVSEQDRALISAEVRSLRIAVVPIIVATGEPRGEFLPHDCVFVGSFDWPPNRDGVMWFVETVWPVIRNEIPTATLRIIGGNPPPELIALGGVAGVTVEGYVRDTKPYLARAAVSVAPLRYGGGMKGKVVEAMSMALPVVTTSVGAQGLNAVIGEHLLVEDSPEGFAAATIRLLRDPALARTIGLAGQAHNKTLCAPELAERTLEELLHDVGPHRPRFIDRLAWSRVPAAYWLRRTKGLVRGAFRR